ncbi:hypothetical protein, partial [Anaerotignum lactatifermentans]|uniref:hypothetical protein n=1 Tax=Anaerotignum lactatifermentans TaxID=160404 RepID=UPI003AB4153E
MIGKKKAKHCLSNFIKNKITGCTKTLLALVSRVLLVNPIKTPGYAGGISELQLQAKTSYAIIILSPPRHKKA